jgi:hypothetical protein
VIAAARQHCPEAPARAVPTMAISFICVWVIVAALCALIEPACAQMTFLADSGTHRMLGPKLAAGAVIWSHGKSIDAEDSLAPTPPYIESFRLRGWDAFRQRSRR